MTYTITYTRFTLDRATPALWRATFNHPPINLIDSVMIRELGDLFAAVERGEGPLLPRKRVVKLQLHRTFPSGRMRCSGWHFREESRAGPYAWASAGRASLCISIREKTAAASVFASR